MAGSDTTGLTGVEAWGKAPISFGEAQIGSTTVGRSTGISLDGGPSQRDAAPIDEHLLGDPGRRPMETIEEANQVLGLPLGHGLPVTLMTTAADANQLSKSSESTPGVALQCFSRMCASMPQPAIVAGECSPHETVLLRGSSGAEGPCPVFGTAPLSRRTSQTSWHVFSGASGSYPIAEVRGRGVDLAPMKRKGLARDARPFPVPGSIPQETSSESPSRGCPGGALRVARPGAISRNQK